jgi:hypothetical protein
MKKLLLLCLIALACSSHPTPEPSPTRTETPLTDCYVGPPPGAIVGFGVNGQPRNWGTNGAAVKGALDMLVNDLGANFFRVEVDNGETDYESTNDDASPTTFNWAYYDALFSTKRFTDLWNYVRYVNSIASTAHVQLSWHGGLPGWFGGTTFNGDGRSYTLPTAMEGEFVETLLAVMVYARTRAPEPRPRFDLISPNNEPESGGAPEGFAWANVAQEARVVRALVVAMNAIPELDGIQLVVGEHNTELMSIDRPSLVADPLILARLAATSFHRYDTAEVIDYKGANPPVFLTEFNSHWRASCYSTIWSYGLEAVTNVVAALQGGATAGLFWSDYDAPHIHQGDEWQTFGLLATNSGGLSEAQLCGHFLNTQPADSVLDAMTYTPKPTYAAVRHVFKWISPNASPITLSASGVSAVAYQNADGTIAVAGVNNGGTVNSTITLTMPNPPAYLTPRVSTATTTDVVGTPVPLTNGQGSFTFPASSVFSLLSSPGSGSGGSGGMGGNGGAAGASAGMAGQPSGGNGGVSGSSSAGGGQGGQGGQSGSGGAASGAGGMSSGGQGGASAGSAGTSGAGMSGAGGAGAAGMAGAAGSSAGTGGSGPTLVAGWNFDEGSGLIANDASGHGHTGTLVNGPTWTTTGCKYGGCLSFDGTNDRVTTPDANDLDLNQTFTLMAWVLPSSVGANMWRPVMIKEEAAGLVYLLYASPKNAWIDEGGTDLQVLVSGNLSTTAWTHVAEERNGTTLSYWVNGAQVGSATVGSANTTASTGVLAIGGHSFWGGEWFKGKIDDPRIYSSALTTTELAAAMGSGL